MRGRPPSPPEGRTLRAIGFDDAPFVRGRTGDVAVAGVVCAGTRFEGLVGAVPEPLRLAHLVGAAVRTGESSRRA